MYCKYCGKVLTTGDRIDSCYPDCNPVKTSAERDQIKAENERLQARVQELEKQASPFLFAGNAILRSENERLKEALKEVPDKPFIVVAVDKPFFKAVYELIRFNEIENGTWTNRDELIYKDLCEINESIFLDNCENKESDK
jgi:glutaredoxin